MNLEKVIFAFFIIFAATLNFGFVIGEIDNPLHHHVWEFFAAFVVNVVATVLKFGDRTQVGATHLATSLVAVFQLAAAALLWTLAPTGPDGAIRAGDHDQHRVAGRRRAAGKYCLGGNPHRGDHAAAEVT